MYCESMIGANFVAYLVGNLMGSHHLEAWTIKHGHSFHLNH